MKVGGACRRVHRGHLRGAISASSVAIGALLLGACSTDGNSVVALGNIEYFGEPAVVDTPAVVRAGQPFRVSVVTYGDGCTRPVRTDTESSDEAIDVLPFDRMSASEDENNDGSIESCTDEIRLLRHEATLTFDVAGERTIRIHGRRVTTQVVEEIQLPFAVVVE